MVKMISIVGAVYALIGVLGYSMFKSDIKGKAFYHKTLLQDCQRYRKLCL